MSCRSIGVLVVFIVLCGGFETFGACAAQGYSLFHKVEGPCGLDFPEDHGPHPDYRSEWWYYTGRLQTSGQRAFGVEADAGPGLVFITLPIVFAGMPGGAVFGTLFFTLLLFAALTSSIGMIEAAVAWLAERTRLGRTGAAIAVGCVSWSLGVLAALSFNLLADVYPLGGIPIFAGKTFFDLFDFIVVNLMMPIGGILVAVFAGWLMKRQYSLDELYGGRPTPGYTAWRFLVRYLAPLVLVGIFVDMLRQAI